MGCVRIRWGPDSRVRAWEQKVWRGMMKGDTEWKCRIGLLEEEVVEEVRVTVLEVVILLVGTWWTTLGP